MGQHIENDSLLFILCPELKDGVIPQNLGGLKERLNCTCCTNIVTKVRQLEGRQLGHIERESKRRLWHYLPFLRRYAPQEDSEFDTVNDRIIDEIQAFQDQDTRHWKGSEQAAVSNEFVARLTQNSNWHFLLYKADELF